MDSANFRESLRTRTPGGHHQARSLAASPPDVAACLFGGQPSGTPHGVGVPRFTSLVFHGLVLRGGEQIVNSGLGNRIGKNGPGCQPQF